MDNRKWRAETSAPVGAGVGRTMRDSGVLSPASQRRGEMALLLPTTSDFDPLTLLELDIATKLCGLCGSPCERGAACICGAVTTSLGSCVDCGAEISAGQRCGGCLLGAGA
jgi:hypothetical protein